MTDHDFFPPLLDLSPDEMRTHRRHLLSEIGSTPRRAKRTRILVIAAAAAGSIAAAAAIAAALVPSAGVRAPNPRSAARPLAPLYSFHASVTAHAPDDRYYSPGGFTSPGDQVIPFLDAAVFPREHIPRAVLALAVAQAHSSGNRGPTRVEWVKTTRQKAVSAENAGRVDGGSLPVYFVILHGRFVAEFTPRPHGAKSPRGRILTDTIEIKTGRILDFAIGNSEPNVSKIKKPHHFVVYGHRRSR